MKVRNQIIAGVMKAGFDRFIKTHKMKDTPKSRALFFSGAAVGIASQGGNELAVAAVVELAMKALQHNSPGAASCDIPPQGAVKQNA